MCILFFAIKQHPKYPVIICANRDEFHQRPTQMMHWWPEKDKKHTILAGKDLQASGTWLGLNQQGRFSALTNFRQPQLFDPNKQSRGDLVIQALAKQDNEITAQLAKSSHRYNGFNLVFGQLNKLTCFDSISKNKQVLTSGFHSLCNGALDDIWPKMALGQSQLANTISSFTGQPLNIETLFTLMQNGQQAKMETLPNTGLPLDWEQRLSSIFIVSPEYGTRTTNIIVQDNKGNISVYDRSYNEQGESIKEQCFSIANATFK
tara:strand:- start:4619 stop:5404 length:786 start_codon:yes stop_codon:yes gene_type:complete